MNNRWRITTLNLKNRSHESYGPTHPSAYTTTDTTAYQSTNQATYITTVQSSIEPADCSPNPSFLSTEHAAQSRTLIATIRKT